MSGQRPTGVVLVHAEDEFYNRRTFTTRAEAVTAVTDWIENIYNRRRRHSALGMQSPVTFEKQHHTTAAIEVEAA